MNLAIVSSVILLNGCMTTPTGNIEAFGVATSDVTQKIDSVISDYNKENINDKLVEMAQTNDKLVKSKFSTIDNAIIISSDTKKFALYKANKALGGYAKSLSDLSKAGSRDEIAMAGVKLSTSLNSMNKEYKVLVDSKKDIISDNDSATLSRIVSEITTYYAEYKRGKALKEIIVTADDSVQLLCDAIINQLLIGVIEERIHTMRGNELAGYFADYNDKVDKLSFAEKKNFLDNIYAKYIYMESSGATIIQAKESISSVKKAHSKLKSELNSDHFNSKELFDAIGEIKKVHNSFDDLEELMVSCQTEIISDAKKGIICKEKETAVK